MKRLAVYIFFSLLTSALVAQEFDVREFKADPNDLAARRYEKRDINDEPCALIKVNTNIRGMKFDSNMGVFDVEHQEDGYWVYVSPRERRIKLMADGYISMDVGMPEPAQSYMVYQLIVVPVGIYHTSDLVKVTFRLNESDVYIQSGESAPVLSIGSNAVFNLPKGERVFKFIKEGLFEESLRVNVQDEEVIDITLKKGASFTKLALSGHIIITSEPTGAEVYLNGQRVGSTSYQNRHLAGEYTLRIKYPNYYEHNEQFTLKEGATVEIPKINLKPQFGHLQVNSTPTGATVHINGRMVGTTPLKNYVVPSGIHEITLHKLNYHSQTDNIRISDGENKTHQIILKEAFGTLKITSEPTNAKVYIDNKEVGQTPYTDKMLTSGNYSLRISKELYSDANEFITIEDGKTTERFVALPKNYGNLSITANGAHIYLDGKKVANNSYTTQLKPGQYKVRAIKEKHRDAEQTVFVKLGQTENINLLPTPMEGALSISTAPFEARGAEIYINGVKQEQTTPATIPLLIGSYNVTLKKSGFKNYKSTKINIIENKEQNLNALMKPTAIASLTAGKKHKIPKILYGTATLASAGAGVYFRYSTISLYNDYSIATTNATDIYNTVKKHEIYSWTAFGAAVPLGVMALVKSHQYKSNLDAATRVSACKRDKYFFGVATLVSAGVGGYYRYNMHTLSKQYQNATTDATNIYGKIEQSEFISNAAFAATLPLAVMYVNNAIQQKRGKKRLFSSAIPTDNGILFSLNFQF